MIEEPPGIGRQIWRNSTKGEKAMFVLLPIGFTLLFLFMFWLALHCAAGVVRC